MTRTTWLVTSAVLAVGVVLGAQGAPQDQAIQPPVTFRSEINYVEVDARVLDGQGAFVPGLTAADFQVLEDGKPQKVDAFSFIRPAGNRRSPIWMSPRRKVPVVSTTAPQPSVRPSASATPATMSSAIVRSMISPSTISRPGCVSTAVRIAWR